MLCFRRKEGLGRRRRSRDSIVSEEALKNRIFVVFLTFQKKEEERHSTTMGATDLFDYLHETLQKRIMIIDGAMGTCIQQLHLTAEDYHGSLRRLSNEIC